MGLTFRDRKRIKNGCLPGFLYGDTGAYPNPYRYNDQGWDFTKDYTAQTGTSIQPQDLTPTRTVINQSISPQKEIMNNPIAPVTKDGITDVTGNWKSGAQSKNNNATSLLSTISPWASLAAWGIGGFINGLNGKVSSGELLLDAGKSYNSFGGISYQTQRAVDDDKVMDQYDKQTLSSMFTNPLEGIGRLFGREDQREQIIEANRKMRRENKFNRSSAASKYMQMKAAQEGYAYGKEPVATSGGIKYEMPNARLDYDERIINAETGEEADVTLGKGKVDGALANIKDSDIILSKRTGAADYYRQTGDLEGAVIMNKVMRNLKHGNGLPGYKWGGLPSAILYGIEGLTAIGDWLNTKNEPVKKIDTRTKNTYENFGLSGLAGLRYSNLPIINAIANRRAASDYALRNSGGLNGAQWYLGSLVNNANMYKAIADANTELQGKNIGLKSNLYNAALTIGGLNASRNQNARQFDEDFYAKGHGARTKMAADRLADIFKIGQGWLQGANKLAMYNETMDLYRQKQKLEEQELLNQIDIANYNNNKATTRTYDPVYSYNLNPQLYIPSNNYFRGINFNMPYKLWRS